MWGCKDRNCLKRGPGHNFSCCTLWRKLSLCQSALKDSMNSQHQIFLGPGSWSAQESCSEIQAMSLLDMFLPRLVFFWMTKANQMIFSLLPPASSLSDFDQNTMDRSVLISLTQLFQIPFPQRMRYVHGQAQTQRFPRPGRLVRPSSAEPCGQCEECEMCLMSPSCLECFLRTEGRALHSCLYHSEPCWCRRELWAKPSPHSLQPALPLTLLIFLRQVSNKATVKTS